jgi:EAL domain-containing protein (putative c-di-GMP-specific phosphodiesterase class I)
LDRDQQDGLLVRSTIALAHSFRLRVVAEGVESARTLEILGQMNWDLAQGYHMARPMPIARLAALLDSGARLKTGTFGLSLPGGDAR